MPFLVHVLASITFYLSSSLAYKLRMIRGSFAMPLTLLTPLMFGISVLVCQYGVVSTAGGGWLVWFPFDFVCESVSALEWFATCGLCLWWASHLWTTGHVWQQAPELDLKNTTIKR
jgi:hypothetical protein